MQVHACEEQLRQLELKSQHLVQRSTQVSQFASMLLRNFILMQVPPYFHVLLLTVHVAFVSQSVAAPSKCCCNTRNRESCCSATLLHMQDDSAAQDSLAARSDGQAQPGGQSM